MNNPRIAEVRETDWRAGDGHIAFKGVTQDWASHIQFFERQLLAGNDTDGCEFFTGQESFDAQMDELMPDIDLDLVAFFSANGYMDTGNDGNLHFHSSPRFLQVKSGVGQSGASMPQVWDTMRAYGVLPWKDLPTDPTLTVAEYFAPIPAQSEAKAIQFLNLIGGKNSIGYHWILQNQNKNVALLDNKLQQAPICLGIAVGQPWNQVTPADPPIGSAPQHAVMLYQVSGQNLSILDHYDPFEKILDAGYEVKYALQGIVNPSYTPPPALPTIPTPTANITPAQAQSILTTIAQWLQSLIPWPHRTIRNYNL